VADPQRVLPKWVRPAIEFGPLLTFFVVQRSTERLGGLYWATVALMVTTSLAVLCSWFLERRVPPVPLITGVFVGILGGLTIYLESELFIKIKPTLVYGTFAAVLLGGLAFHQLFLRSVLGEALVMGELGWRLLSVRLGLFCAALAASNEVFRRVLDTDTWTTVKTFGYASATMVFLVFQGSLIEAHAPKKGPDDAEPPATGA